MATVYDPVSQCGAKRQFATARDAVERARAIGMKSGTWLQAYRCPHCGFFHLGHAVKHRRSTPAGPATEVSTQ